MCFKEEEAPSMPLTWCISGDWAPISDSSSLHCLPPLLSQESQIRTTSSSWDSPQAPVTPVSFLSAPTSHSLSSPSATTAPSTQISVCSGTALRQALGAGAEICPLKMRTAKPNVYRKQGGLFYMYPGFLQIIQQMSLRHRGSDGRAQSV